MESEKQTIDEIELAKEHREFAHTHLQYADNRLNKISDSLADKMLQIATIIFAFSTAFLSKQILGSLWIKNVFIIGLFLLLMSIVFGVVHELVRRKFWIEWSEKRNRIFMAFNEARRGKIPFSEACARNNEIVKVSGVNLSSAWPFIVQAILLILGTLGILMSIAIHLYN